LGRNAEFDRRFLEHRGKDRFSEMWMASGKSCR
jgi:hypothetical protein